MPSDDPRPGSKELCRTPAARHADHYFLRDDDLFQSLAFAIFLILSSLMLCHLSQCEFAKCCEISLSKEIVERLFDLLDRIDLSLPQPRSERVDRNIDIDDLVGALKKAIGNGFANLNTGRSRDHVIERFDVLDIDGRDDRDAVVEQFEDVLVTLFMFFDPAMFV